MLRNISLYGAAVQRDGAKRNRAAAWLDVPALTVSDTQGAAVQRDGAKRNRVAAWLDRKTHLTFHYTAHTSV